MNAAGLAQRRVLRARLLRRSSTERRSAAAWIDRSVPVEGDRWGALDQVACGLPVLRPADPGRLPRQGVIRCERAGVQVCVCAAPDCPCRKGKRHAWWRARGRGTWGEWDMLARLLDRATARPA